MRTTRFRIAILALTVVAIAVVGIQTWRAVSEVNAPPPTPYLPTTFQGQRVYRAADEALFAGLPGSFMLGGVLTYPDVMPPCASEAGPPGRGQGLVPYCYWPSIDGLAISPKTPVDAPNGVSVVARVHVHDPSAADCIADVRPDCEAAIVVEQIVWTNAVAQAGKYGLTFPVTSRMLKVAPGGSGRINAQGV